MEPTTAGHENLVTFLWRSRADTKVVVLTDFGDYIPHMTLRRMSGTDVWYRRLRLRNDARFLYELAVDDPAFPFVDGDSVKSPSAVQPDPLNPKRYEYLKPHIFSLAELQGAPSLEMATANPTVPRGIVGRFPQLLRRIAQSGAFWRGIGHTAKYWSDPSRDEALKASPNLRRHVRPYQCATI